MDQADRPVVAVVDDEESVRRALVRLLRTENYCAEGFASAAEFLEALATHRPECLILDLQMPQMSGLELLQRMLATGQGPPVIIITAYDEQETREQCLALGIEFYFRKPIAVDGLLTAVDQIMRNVQAGRNVPPRH